MRFILLLLVTAASLAIAGPIVEGRERSAEQSVRAYLDAVRTGDVEGALERLQPDEREPWRIFVQHQAGDRVHILSLAVERRPLMRDIRGWMTPAAVTIVGEITGKGGEQWRATSLVAGAREGDRWLMQRPPFGPEEPWLIPPED